MDTLGAMRVFARVVEAGSFSAAGRELGLAPSSVSRQVAELERELGATLLHRTTRRLSLTEAGQVYHARVGAVLHEVDEARLALEQLDGSPSGVLRITAPSGVGRFLLADAVPAFCRRHPAVKVVFSMTDQLLDLIEEEFDLGIRMGRLRDSSLRSRKLGESRRVLCASPDYLVESGVPSTPAELAEHNCLTWRDHPGANLWRFEGPAGRAEVRVTGNLFAANADALAAAAVAGLGLILLPDWNVGIELRDERLVPALADWRPLPAATPVYAVYPQSRHVPPKVRAFVDFLAERLASRGRSLASRGSGPRTPRADGSAAAADARRQTRYHPRR